MASFDRENREIKVEPEYFDVAGQSQSTPILNFLVDSENFAFQMDSNENDSYFKNCDGKDLLLFHENTSNQTQFHENIVKTEVDFEENVKMENFEAFEEVENENSKNDTFMENVEITDPSEFLETAQNLIDAINDKQETNEKVTEMENQSHIQNCFQPGVYEVPTRAMKKGEKLPEGAVVFLPVFQKQEIVKSVKKCSKTASEPENKLPDVFEVSCKGLKALFHKNLFHSGGCGNLRIFLFLLTV